MLLTFISFAVAQSPSITTLRYLTCTIKHRIYTSFHTHDKSIHQLPMQQMSQISLIHVILTLRDAGESEATCDKCFLYTKIFNSGRGISSIGRARRSQRRGTGIETRILHLFVCVISVSWSSCVVTVRLLGSLKACIY